MLLNILLVILVIDCVALTAVILLQRSEGGALGMGGGPSGMFTARGAGDLLTRTTSILTVGFFLLSLGITLLAGHNHANTSITDRLKVNPIDLNGLARPSQSPAASGAPAAPPLPTAPPLPGAIPPLPNAASAPVQPPRPAVRTTRERVAVAPGAPSSALTKFTLGSPGAAPPPAPRASITGLAPVTGSTPASSAPASQ